MSEFFKGWRTILIGLLVALVPAALQYLANIDWTAFVSPDLAAFITGVIMVALRLVTTGPAGTKE